MISRILYILAIQLVSAKDDEIFVKVDPETLIKGFRAMMTSDYLRTLADDFASKAAQHLIAELQKNNDRIKSTKDLTRLKAQDRTKSIFNKPGVKKPQRPEVSLLGPVIPYKSYDDVDGNKLFETATQVAANEMESKNSYELKASDQLLKFLREPSPDGDYLDRESELTDYEANKTPPPALQNHRINGKHFRRISFDFIFI